MAYLLTPASGPDVCERCFNPTRPGFARCFHCAATEPRLDAFLPISYCLAGSPLHHDLLDYKHTAEPAVPFLIGRLARVLDTFLVGHEQCLGALAGSGTFPLVTTVPSSVRHRDEHHPLRRLVGDQASTTRARHRRLLVRTELELPPRTFHPRRFECVQPLDGAGVLLIDDVWTTGSSAESAAAALKRSPSAATSTAIGWPAANGWAG